MHFKNVGYLMFPITVKDDMNRPKKDYKEKKVFCNVKSVGFNEFFQAQAVGYKPEIKIELRLVDVANATHFKLKDTIYKIIRYYKFEDKIELTLNATVIKNGLE